jgi:hypothetical protein
VKLFKGYILPVVTGMGIALAVVLVKDASTPQEVAQEYGTPVVCMQDAPIIYDWNNNLIVGKMYE